MEDYGMKTSLSTLAFLAGISLGFTGCTGNESADSVTQADQSSTVIDIVFDEIVSLGNTDKNPADQYLQTGADGQVLMTWTEDSGGVRARNAFMAALSSEGNLAGEAQRINDVPGEVHWYGGDNRLKFTVATDGGMTAVYASPLKEFKTGIVKTAHAERTGDSFRSAILNDDEAGPVPVAHAFATIATSPNGKVYATWIDSRNRTFTGMAKPESTAERRKDIKMRDLTIPESVMKMGPTARRNFVEQNSQLWMAVSEDGGKTFGKNYPITEIVVCACCVPTISFLDGGDTVVVSYRYVTEDYLRDNVVIRSTDGGKTFSEPTYISEDGWVAKFCPHAGSSVIADNTGRLHSLWFTGGRADADEAGIYYTYSDNVGKTFAPRKLMAKTPPHTVLHAQIVVDGNNHFWGVWENIAEGEMKPQIFLAHRAADDAEWSETYQVSDGTTTAMLPTLAADGQKVYVSWTEKHGEASAVKVRTAALASS
jgi:hypothetical protein